MNRQHILGYSVVILLFLTCGLFAQHEAQDMNGEAIKTVVRNHLQALQQGKHAEVVALSDFRDNKEREAFQKSLKKRGAVRKLDLEQGLHFVRARRKNDHTQALLLLPTKQGFLPEKFSIREVKGQLKLVHKKKKKSKERDFDITSAKLAELRESLKDWRTAEGVALAKKCLVLKEQLQEEIDALEYAKTKKLQIVPGYGGLVVRRKAHDDVRNLSDEDLQAKVVEEIQFAIEALSP